MSNRCLLTEREGWIKKYLAQGPGCEPNTLPSCLTEFSQLISGGHLGMGDKFTELTFEKLATAFHLLLVTKSLLLSNCCSAVFSRDFFTT